MNTLHEENFNFTIHNVDTQDPNTCPECGKVCIMVIPRTYIKQTSEQRGYWQIIFIHSTALQVKCIREWHGRADDEPFPHWREQSWAYHCELKSRDVRFFGVEAPYE